RDSRGGCWSRSPKGHGGGLHRGGEPGFLHGVRGGFGGRAGLRRVSIRGVGGGGEWRPAGGWWGGGVEEVGAGIALRVACACGVWWRGCGAGGGGGVGWGGAGGRAKMFPEEP